jgi:hypothetical protein
MSLPEEWNRSLLKAYYPQPVILHSKKVFSPEIAIKKHFHNGRIVPAGGVYRAFALDRQISK